jgi:hypothetical protein
MSKLSSGNNTESNLKLLFFGSLPLIVEFYLLLPLLALINFCGVFINFAHYYGKLLVVK